MGRGGPRIPSFRPIPPSTRSSFSTDQQKFQDDATFWSAQEETMNPFRMFDASTHHSGMGRLPHESQYRDAMGVSLSMLTISGNVESDAFEDGNESMEVEDSQQSSPNDTMQRILNDSPAAGDIIEHASSADWRTKLPPGFPIPLTARSKSTDRTTQAVKTRSKQIVRPVVSKKPPNIRKAGADRTASASTPRTPTILPDLNNAQQSSMGRPFRIRDTETVFDYLKERLIQLQQASLKRAAKEWIKAICPKKQARYPYSESSKRNRDESDNTKEPRIPPWWPPLHLCPHKEPDHVMGEHRINLMIHLVRLRPSPEVLNEWMRLPDGLTYPTTLRSDQWTASLKELTPLSLFKTVPGESTKKVARRPQVLDDFFRIAEMEEEWMIGGNDGTDTIAWIPDPEAKLQKRKRPSVPFVRVKRSRTAASSTPNLASSPDDSDSGPPRDAKRRKKNVQAKKAGRSLSNKDVKRRAKNKGPVVHMPTSSASEEIAEPMRDTSDSAVHNVLASNVSDRPIASSINPSLNNTSFNSTTSAESGWSSQLSGPRCFIQPNAAAQRNRNQQVNSLYDMSLHQPHANAGLRHCDYQGMNFNMDPNTPLSNYLMPYPSEGKMDSNMLPHGNSIIHHGLAQQMIPDNCQYDPQMGYNANQQGGIGRSDQWQPSMVDIPRQPQAQTGLQRTGVPNMYAPPSVPVQTGSNAGWNPEWQRPHGLPTRYEADSLLGCFPDEPALPGPPYGFNG